MKSRKRKNEKMKKKNENELSFSEAEYHEKKLNPRWREQLELHVLHRCPCVAAFPAAKRITSNTSSRSGMPLKAAKN